MRSNRNSFLLNVCSTRIIFDCDQSNVGYSSRALFSFVFFQLLFSSFLFTSQIAVPTASPRRQHQPCNWRHVTSRDPKRSNSWPHYLWGAIPP